MRSIRLRWSCAVLATVVGTLTTSATGQAYSLTSHEWDQPIALRLESGRRLEGRYRGTIGAPTATPYAKRYAAWLDEVGSTSAPALGETLIVERGVHEPLRGVFGGFFGGELLLATEDSCSFLVVRPPANGVRRTDEPAMDSDWIAARDLWRSGPTPHAYVVQVEEGTVAVPATSIVSSRSSPCAGGGSGGGGGGGGGAVAAGVIVGVLLGAAIAYVAVGAAVASAFSHLMI